MRNASSSSPGGWAELKTHQTGGGTESESLGVPGGRQRGPSSHPSSAGCGGGLQR